MSEITAGEVDEVLAQKGTKNYIFTNEIDTIAGFPCKKAIVVFDEIDTKEIEIYYTDRIKMKNANWYNPFKEIPGVMLRYEFDQYDMRMRLEASSVLAREVTDNEFSNLPEFEQVDPIRLQHELEEVLSTFSL
jgi:GLPGLI family protein